MCILSLMLLDWSSSIRSFNVCFIITSCQTGYMKSKLLWFITATVARLMYMLKCNLS